MDADGYYSPKDVRTITGASESAVRNYCRDYERWLSTDATSIPRRFSAEDVKLIAFVIDCTKKQNKRHDEVLIALQAGELDAFAWEAPPQPTVSPETAQAPQVDASTAMVPYAHLRAAELLMAKAEQREQALAEREREREQEAALRERELQAHIEDLQRQVGELSGELKAVKAHRRQAPKWWRAMFGGREDS